MVKFNTVIYMMDDYLMKCSNDYIRGRLSKMSHEEKQEKLLNILSEEEYFQYTYWWDNYQFHKKYIENIKNMLAQNPSSDFWKDMLSEYEEELVGLENEGFSYEKYIYRKHKPVTYSVDGYTEGLTSELREINAQKNIELSNKEKQSLDSYISIGYHPLNKRLWNDEELKDWMKEFDDNLSSAIRKNKLIENTVLYNGGHYPNLKVGDKINFKGYTSTSYDINVARTFQNGCIYKFLAPKDTPCINMNGFFSDTEFETEHECLLDKNLKGTIVGFETYRVDDIQWEQVDIPVVVVQL